MRASAALARNRRVGHFGGAALHSLGPIADFQFSRVLWTSGRLRPEGYLMIFASARV